MDDNYAYVVMLHDMVRIGPEWAHHDIRTCLIWIVQKVIYYTIKH